MVGQTSCFREPGARLRRKLFLEQRCHPSGKNTNRFPPISLEAQAKHEPIVLRSCGGDFRICVLVAGSGDLHHDRTDIIPSAIGVGLLDEMLGKRAGGLLMGEQILKFRVTHHFP